MQRFIMNMNLFNRLAFVVGIFFCSLRASDVQQKNTPDQAIQGLSALHYAARDNDMGSLRNLLLHKGIQINVQDAQGKTPLQYAIEYNSDPQIIRMLLNMGADVNVQDMSGQTSLHYAVRYNNDPDIVNLLLNHSAYVNVPDKEGNTALHYAVQYLSTHSDKESSIFTGTMVYFLLYNGADVTLLNKEGKSPLDYPVNRIIKRQLEQYKVSGKLGLLYRQLRRKVLTGIWTVRQNGSSLWNRLKNMAGH